MSDSTKTSPQADQPHKPKFVIGVCVNHDVADGSSINQFLMAWALASINRPFPTPATHHRDWLLDTEVEGVEPYLPPHLAHVNLFEKIRIVANLMLDRSYTAVTVEFPPQELDAIKAAAMEEFEGTDLWVSTSNALAAHLWPVLSDLHPYGLSPGELCPLWSIVNARKAMQMPPSYFGNAATVQRVAFTNTDESLGQRAIKIRRACEVTDQSPLRAHAAYLQHLQTHNKISSITFSPMVDNLHGHPSLLWDDVSGFNPPKGAPIAMAGVLVKNIDFFMEPITPGFAMVLPRLNGGGKKVTFAVHKKHLARFHSAELQNRIHSFRPVADEETKAPQ